MKANTCPQLENSPALARHLAIALAAVQLGALAATAAFFSGCARRPIVVQSPPATVIQNPAPAPTATVIQTAPAAANQPTGRDVVVVKEPPPPPRTEAPPPPPPSSEYRWVPGYWASRNGRTEWVEGHWEMPPRSEATWVPPRWERRGDGYVFVEGYWK